MVAFSARSPSDNSAENLETCGTLVHLLPSARQAANTQSLVPKYDRSMFVPQNARLAVYQTNSSELPSNGRTDRRGGELSVAVIQHAIKHVNCI